MRSSLESRISVYDSKRENADAGRLVNTVWTVNIVKCIVKNSVNCEHCQMHCQIECEHSQMQSFYTWKQKPKATKKKKRFGKIGEEAPKAKKKKKEKKRNKRKAKKKI